MSVTFWQAILLGALQGLTEFLPVSSSAHLILVQRLLPGFAQPGILFDVMLHVGTLVAVVAFFRERIGGLLRDSVSRDAAARRGAWKMALLLAVSVGLTGALTLPAEEVRARGDGEPPADRPRPPRDGAPPRGRRRSSARGAARGGVRSRRCASPTPSSSARSSPSRPSSGACRARGTRSRWVSSPASRGARRPSTPSSSRSRRSSPRPSSRTSASTARPGTS